MRFLKYWLPFLAWMAFIFIGSGDVLSANHTSRFIVPFLHWLMPQLSPEALERVHMLIRKLAHVTEYAILAILIWRALFHGTTLDWKPSRFFFAAWIICLFMAGCDEFRQSFVASRGPSVWDVMIDGVGAALGLGIYWLIIKQLRHQSILEDRKSRS